MTESQKTFAKKLLSQTKTYEEWLSVVRFGLPTLLDDQELLIDAIMCQAEAMAINLPAPLDVLMRNAVCICRDLDLRFVVGGE